MTIVKKVFSWVLFEEFYIFRSYVEILNPFCVDFGVWYKVGPNFVSLVYG